MKSRVIVIGDVHGCLETLQELLSKVKYVRGQDRLIFVGDLTDRGPDVPGVVRYIFELQAEVCASNHDEKHCAYRADLDLQRQGLLQGSPRRLSPGQAMQNKLIPDEHIRWLAAAPTVIKVTSTLVVVHAGFEPGRSMEDQKPEQIIRVRYVNGDGLWPTDGAYWNKKRDGYFWADKWVGPVNVIYGHSTMNKPYRVDNERPDGSKVWTFGIDTGCVYGGSLTAAVVDPETDLYKTVSVRAKKAYYLGDSLFEEPEEV